MIKFNRIIKGILHELVFFLIYDYWDTFEKIHFSFLVVVSSDEEGPIEHKSSEILKLQCKQDHEVTNENENISESALSELPSITCESVQVIYFCLLTDSEIFTID